MSDILFCLVLLVEETRVPEKKTKKTAVLPQVTDNLLYKIALDTSYHKQESNSQL
jgi:hypothetical protein